MGLPKINIMTQKNVSVLENLQKLKGDDGIINTREEAITIHNYYLSMLNKSLNSADRERLCLANRTAEEIIQKGRKDNFWTLMADAYSGAKKLYARYFENKKQLAENK